MRNILMKLLLFETVKDTYEKVIQDFKEAERIDEAGEYFDRKDELAGGFV